MDRKFDAQVRKVGNSHVISIPASIVRKFKLKQGKFLTITLSFDRSEQTIKREFDAQIRKVGNSYVITVPSSIIKRFNLKQGEFLTINASFEEDGKD